MITLCIWINVTNTNTNTTDNTTDNTNDNITTKLLFPSMKNYMIRSNDVIEF